jgi:hypothetical protein
MLIKLFILLIMAASIGFCTLVQMRLLNYVKKNPLPESKYTSIFGFIRLLHVNLFYILSVVCHAVLFIWLTFTYL